jgi:PTH1 family peptidyl-tRNA hydrolase
MKLIVGLGNPGKQYEKTRHNLGFWAIEALVKKLDLQTMKKGFNAHYYVDSIRKIILCKPQTYMNLSGSSVHLIAHFYDIPLEDIIILTDDLALPEGKIRLREKGSSGSHNGLASVIAAFQSQAIKRIRLGIGSVPVHEEGKDYVLQTPSKTSESLLRQAADLAADAVIYAIEHGFSQAMNVYNRGDSS